MIIYINDLTYRIGDVCSVGLYADDVRCWSTDPGNLQIGLNRLEEWCRDFQIALSPAKCVYGVFGKGVAVPPLLSGLPVPTLSAPAHRDLGVLVDPSLSFGPHVSSKIALAKGKASQILRSLHTLDPHTLYAAFTTYVIPHLEFASVVFNGLSKCNSKRIESVQKDFTHRIFRRAGLKRVSYDERLDFLGGFRLSVRRDAADVAFAHAVLLGLHHCPVIRPEPRATRASLRLPPRALVGPIPRKQLIRAPQHRIASLYNSLPADIRRMKIGCFKVSAKEHLARKFHS
jgi:hypothetical protein